MIGLLQRVSNASVVISSEHVAEINTGLLVLIGIEKGDGVPQIHRLTERLLNYRVFADADGKMNLSLRNINGDLLLVPQFTLSADTKKGSRPSFSSVASPDLGEQRFMELVAYAKQQYDRVSSGVFGADMQVSLTNDGPVTFWLQVKPDL